MNLVKCGILLTVSLLLGASILHANITTNLVGWWKFDESSGNAIDSSSNNNTGTANGTTILSAGCHLNNCRSFSGTEYIAFTEIPLTGAFTMSFWYKTANNAQTGIIMGDTTGSSGGGRKIGMSGGSFFIRLLSDTDTTIAVPAVNTWHMITLTRNASNKADLYVDNGTANRLYLNVAQSDTYQLRTIGSNGVNGGDQYFTGTIDEVRVYDRALSAADIAELYTYSGPVKRISINTRAHLPGFHIKSAP